MPQLARAVAKAPGEDQAQAADWLRESLHPFAQDVGSVVPPVFPAFARIFHPARLAERSEIDVRWSDVASQSGNGPNLWRPDDRAWCVASEIDFPYTYVGRPQALIDAIISDPAIEALAATPADGITYDSDKINSYLVQALPAGYSYAASDSSFIWAL